MKLEKRFRISPKEKVNLSKHDPDDTAGITSKEGCEAALAKNIERLFELQTLLAASSKYAVLIVLQAMDAGGKEAPFAT
jgi:polyphosphate kinase 2 (PPK2 family)